MRAGDTVKHVPSGEKWLLKLVNGKDVYPAGWPETLAKLDDCILIKACSDEKHEEMLQYCLSDFRSVVYHKAKDQLYLLNKGFVGAFI